MKYFFVVFFICMTVIAQAVTVTDNLVSQAQSGSAKNIARYCSQTLSRELSRVPLNETRLKELLDNQDVAKLCFVYLMAKQIAASDSKALPAFKDREFVRFVMSHPTLTQELAFSGKSSGLAMSMLHQLWLQEKKQLNGVPLIIALGAGLSLSDKDQEEDRLARFRFYQQSWNEKKLFAQFDSLHAWEMSILFQSSRSIDELTWAQSHTASKENFTAQNAGTVACGFIPYRLVNTKGVSIHKGSEFYDGKPQTLPILVEYGGVCGAVSTSSCGFLAAKGIPAYTISQPGHCAFVWKGTDRTWKIGNNIYGWLWSGNLTPDNLSPLSGQPYMIYAAGRFQEHSQLVPSWLCREFARLVSSEKTRLALLNKATQLCKWNIPAWIDLAILKAAPIPKNERGPLVAEYAQRFQEEPVLMRKFVAEGIRYQPGKTGALKQAALILGSASSQEAQDAYMQVFSQEAQKAIPDLADLLNYTVNTRKKYFSTLSVPLSKKKVSGSIKRQLCQFLEKAIPDLLGNSSLCGSLLDVYAKQLTLWKDEKYQKRGIAFLKELLKKTEKDSHVAQFIKSAGSTLAQQLDNPQDQKFFS